MAGKSGQKSRLSGRRGAEGRATPAKRQKGIKQFLQPRPPPADARDSSEEPEEQAGPSQTPAVGLLAAPVPPTAGAPTGAGAMLQTALLRSLQHRFATQQALETPALTGSSTQLAAQAQQQGAAPMDVQQQQQQAQQQAQPPQQQLDQAEDEEDEEEDGFQIFSQLAYEPTFLSQRPPEPAADPGEGVGPAATSQQPTQTQLPASQQCAAPPAGPASTAEEEDDGEWPASQLLSQPAASQQQQADAARRASGALAAPKTTPALHSSERMASDARPAEEAPRLFHLFRTRTGSKRVYIVRHGESAYNEAMARSSSWADPLIFDARLTEKGRQQARTLRSELAGLNLPADTLWVTSPLSRAIETLLLGCPTAHLLRQAPGGGAVPSSSAASGSTENSAAAPNGGSEQPPRVMVLPCISEKVVTCGDIGHPASVLCKRFPELADPLGALPELWWYTGKPGKPNCALQKRFESHETQHQVELRVGAFRRWLSERPESTIVAVGHSSYWRSFEQSCHGSKPERMRNCEFRCILY